MDNLKIQSPNSILPKPIMKLTLKIEKHFVLQWHHQRLSLNNEWILIFIDSSEYSLSHTHNQNAHSYNKQR
jgi:hypothetical protein